MKNIVHLSLLIFCLGGVGYSQDAPIKPMERREKIKERMEAQQVAFLTNKLDLSSDESAKFWPVYNEFSKKRMELRKQMKSNVQMENLDEQQSAKAVDNQFAFQEKELALKKSYYEKFKAILPASKLAKLEPAEQEFRQEVIRKLKEHRQKRKDR